MLRVLQNPQAANKVSVLTKQNKHNGVLIFMALWRLTEKKVCGEKGVKGVFLNDHAG